MAAEAGIVEIVRRTWPGPPSKGEPRMTKFQTTVLTKAFAGLLLIQLGWLLLADRAAAQAAPAAAAKPRNAILSGSSTLPSAEAAVERAAKEMAEAALNFWAG